MNVILFLSKYLVKKNNASWIDLTPLAKTKNRKMINVTMNDDGILTGNLIISRSGYEGVSERRSILSQGEEEFAEEYWDNDDQEVFTTSEHKWTNIKDFNLPIRHDCNIEINTQKIGDNIYIEPIQIKFFEENPFQLEERLFPINFGYSFQETYAITINLPEGYEIIEVPKNTILTTSDQSSKFSYSLGKQGNTIQMRATLAINKLEYPAQYYQELKEFFNLIITKQNEKIVLKKV